jgi:hypothetical protein
MWMVDSPAWATGRSSGLRRTWKGLNNPARRKLCHLARIGFVEGRIRVSTSLSYHLATPDDGRCSRHDSSFLRRPCGVY